MYKIYKITSSPVVDFAAEELKKYIQENIIELKNKKIGDMFITASQGKLDTIIALEKILDQFNKEEE